MVMSGGHLHLERMPLIFQAPQAPMETWRTKHSSAFGICLAYKRAYTKRNNWGFAAREWPWWMDSVFRCPARNTFHSLPRATFSTFHWEYRRLWEFRTRASDSFALSPPFWNLSLAGNRRLTNTTKRFQAETENSHKNNNKNKTFFNRVELCLLISLLQKCVWAFLSVSYALLSFLLSFSLSMVKCRPCNQA